MEEILKRLQKEFPDHTFSLYKGELYIDKIHVGYYLVKEDKVIAFETKKDLKETLWKQLVEDVIDHLNKCKGEI